MAVRFKRMNLEDWKHEKVRQRDVEKSYGFNKGTVMFPSSQDITKITLTPA
jgi:hypothetical protein